MPHSLWAVLLSLTALQASVPSFEPNIGQAESRIRYLARTAGSRAFLHDAGIDFPRVRLLWKGSAARAEWLPTQPTGDTFRYCNLPDPALCRQDIPSYRRLLRRGLYPGIDWVVYGRGQNLEYDLILHPGARPADIRLHIEGAPASLDRSGRLRAGNLLHWRPEAYQWIDGARQPVSARLAAAGDGGFTFVLGDHRPDLDLIIDPVIETIAVSGGSGDDVTLGTCMASGGGDFRFGLTRSADWIRSETDRGTDVFVQYTRWMWGRATVFWGGEGDEQIGGSDCERNNGYLYLAGWTSSRNAPLLARSGWQTHEYAGGETDGFVLEFAGATLAYASYFGGPGADRLYEVRRLNQTGASLLLAGETGDIAWPETPVRRVGPGGGIDAVVGLFNTRNLTLVAIGGSGSDRAMRARPAGQNWVIAGETDSADFPAPAGVRGARDLWAASLTADLLGEPRLRVFGGSGDDSFGGLAVVTGEGIYLAGSTTSEDLPAARNSYSGGGDGFITRLDSLSLSPLVSSYIGGDGYDEIRAMELQSGDLFLGGATNSPNLSELQSNPAIGGVDGLFVLCDAFAYPVFAQRVGGAADDRVFGVEPRNMSSVTLAGASESAEWFEQVDRFSPGRGSQDGFAARLSFPAVRLEANSLYLGRDLQIPLSVNVVSEPGADGVLIFRSSDPARLLLSAAADQPGSEFVVLSEADLPNRQSFVHLQALSDEGEVEVLVEGRPGAAYPRRRVRVRLAPAALFFSPPSEIHTWIRQPFQLYVEQAPVLPGGGRGEPQRRRPGAAWPISVVSADPGGLPEPKPDQVVEERWGVFRLSLFAARPGSYVLTPTSPRLSPAPGEKLTVHVGATVSRVFPTADMQLAKDHVMSLAISGTAGDTLLLTSEDPSKLRLGTDSSASLSALSLSFGSSAAVVYVTALAQEGVAAIRAEGTFQGAPAAERMQVRLIPYTAVLSGVPETVAAGNLIYARLELKLLPNQPLNYPMGPKPGLLSGIRAVSSNPAVVEFVSQGSDPSYFTFRAKQTGFATLELTGGLTPDVPGLRASVEVVPLRVHFGSESMLIPTGAAANLYPSTNGAGESISKVRLRLNQGSPLVLEWLGERGADMTIDFSRYRYYAQLSAENAPPGSQSTLYISAPGVPEYSVPVRVSELVFTAPVEELRVPASPEPRGFYFDAAAYENGRITPASPSVSVRELLTLQPRFSPEGICEATHPLESGGGRTANVLGLRCISPGETTLTLEPAPPVSEAQRNVALRIISDAPPEAVLALPNRILVGRGLQIGIPLTSSAAGITRITSSDPERVRLTKDPKALGGAGVTFQPGEWPFAYVQGLAAEGSAVLLVETGAGLSGQLPVFLFPSTLAVRPSSDSWTDAAGIFSIEHPLSTPDMSLDVRPYLVEPASQKLIGPAGLQVRGATDPFFVHGDSTVPEVLQAVPPAALMQETANNGTLRFRVKQAGLAVVSASQPEGFVAVPASALHVQVVRRELRFRWPVLLSPGMQHLAWLNPGGSEVQATLTSLEPEKLVVSSSQSVAGQASLTVDPAQPIYLQATAAALPGTKLRIRIEAPGYEPAEEEIAIEAPELQLESSRLPIEVSPQQTTAQNLRLAYGPVDPVTGRVFSTFNGSMSPGVQTMVRVSSSDSSIVRIVQESPALDRFLNVGIHALRPGSVDVRIEAPPGIVNRAETIGIRVLPFTFYGATAEQPARYLVSKYQFNNPRSEPVTVTLSTTGAAPLRLGSAPSGPEAPSASSMTVTLGPLESRAIYLEPLGQGQASLTRSASDFSDQVDRIWVAAPQVVFDTSSPLIAHYGSTPPRLSLVLSAESSSQFPLTLGAALGTLRVELRSSDPSVVRVAPVDFRAGDSRAAVPLELVGRGDAVITLISPAGFNERAPRRDLLITVR